MIEIQADYFQGLQGDLRLEHVYLNQKKISCIGKPIQSTRICDGEHIDTWFFTVIIDGSSQRYEYRDAKTCGLWFDFVFAAVEL